MPSPMTAPHSQRFLFIGPSASELFDDAVPKSLLLQGIIEDPDQEISRVFCFPDCAAAIRFGVEDAAAALVFNRMRPLSGGSGRMGDPVILHPTVYFGFAHTAHELAQDPDNDPALIAMARWNTPVGVSVRGPGGYFFNPQPGSSVYHPQTGVLLFERTADHKDLFHAPSDPALSHQTQTGLWPGYRAGLQ